MSIFGMRMNCLWHIVVAQHGLVVYDAGQRSRQPTKGDPMHTVLGAAPTQEVPQVAYAAQPALGAAAIALEWVRQGKIDWDTRWINDHGFERDRVPTREDHIAFANYDLGELGLPTIVEVDGGLEIRLEAEQLRKVFESRQPRYALNLLLNRILLVCRYHGFELDRFPTA